MISAPQVLNYIVSVLEAAGRPLVAREICSELRTKGVFLEKMDLNQILWKQNARPDLVVDRKTFKWRYVPDLARHAEEAERRLEETRIEVAKQAEFLRFWDNIGFEFLGVTRQNTAKPFFFIREDGGEYVLIGPAGNLLREKSVKCSEPDVMSPSQFTLEQVKKAAEEFLADRHRKVIAEAHDIISNLRDTELFADEVYRGPEMERVDDVIPVSAVIFVASVGALVSDTLALGWGAVLEPVYLVVNTLGFGICSDARYGVFKLCVYGLLKRGLIAESEGGFCMNVFLEGERVYIGTEMNRLCLI